MSNCGAVAALRAKFAERRMRSQSMICLQFQAAQCLSRSARAREELQIQHSRNPQRRAISDTRSRRQAVHLFVHFFPSTGL